MKSQLDPLKPTALFRSPESIELSLRLFIRCFAILLCYPGLLLAADQAPLPPKSAISSITASGLLRHIKVLASDKFEGRAPGSRGEELSVDYITTQFKKLGLKPGNPDGSYTQEVPLAGILGAPTASFNTKQGTIGLNYPDDYVATSSRIVPQVSVTNSEIIFVGYGVVAPEYGWDDYKDVDVRGKTILMLINDPQIPDPADSSRLDDKMFKGKAMTYYGRWTYKYEIAAQKGAAAAVIIHETEPAAYPYSVVRTSWSKENFELDAQDKNMGTVAIRSWITVDVAKKLLANSGLDFAQLKKAALGKDFRPVSTGGKANFEIKQTVRSFKSHNVVGRLEGSDRELRKEWLLYSAHWDHLGLHPELPGDKIFNGAIDNASGVAGLIELARAHSKLKPATKRSVLFIATTAEEAGLLGAKYYAEHPLYALENTLADINMDGLGVWGKTRDVEDVSYGNSDLDDIFGKAAARHGRQMKPNSQPEKGGFYRADNFEFSKIGVPSLYVHAGKDFIGKPARFGEDKQDEWVAKIYHQPSDEVKADWDLSGGVEDVQLLFEAGYQVANAKAFPEWKQGTEFKAKREEMLKGAER
ncbi:MAG: putative aminopeptidase [Verrucomicrobiales bacterium]|nr:putative aminopeptidase [Verrucomicrobiales bacterium]MDB6130389.1 putative aminopeptidase [Verrucomicrobiales bacterium]